jgi:hypothetical protein
MMIAKACLMTIVAGGGSSADHSTETLETLSLLGLELSAAPADESPMTLLDLPGWGDITGRPAKAATQLNISMRSLPGIGHEWRSIGTSTVVDPPTTWKSIADDFDNGFGHMVTVEPPVLTLVADQTTGYAFAEVAISASESAVTPFSVNAPLGCGFEIETDLPLVISTEPARLRIGFDLSSPNAPENFFLPLIINGSVGRMIPIRWDGERPRQVTISSDQVPLLVGDRTSLLISSNSASAIELGEPKHRPGLSIRRNRLSDWQVELELELTSSEGYGLLPLHLTGPYGIEDRRVLIVPPWPVCLSPGQWVVGASATAGERLLVVKMDNREGLSVLFPDRFPGIERVLPIQEILGEEVVPSDGRTLLRQTRPRYGISLHVDSGLEPSLPRWRKEWR